MSKTNAEQGPEPRPVFLVSLPRAGSTLLQRMLTANPDVASSAEPWILLPLWGCREPDAGAAAYQHKTAAYAINDFVQQIDGGEAAYHRAVRAFAMQLYAAASGGKPVFLDKTPRYFLMMPMLESAFPEARRILLMRHPLAVLSSLCQTFNNNRFRWFEHWIDWIEGHRNLAVAVRSRRSQDLVVHYEQLVTQTDTELARICAHIGIDFTEQMATNFHSVKLSGRMGDPTGVQKYQSVSGESLDKWRDFFDTPYRRRRAQEMLAYISDADLQTLGYPRAQIIEELNATPARRSLDLRSRADQVVCSLARVLDYRYLQARFRPASTQLVYAHGYVRIPK